MESQVIAHDVKPGFVIFCIHRNPDGKCGYFLISALCLFYLYRWLSYLPWCEPWFLCTKVVTISLFGDWKVRHMCVCVCVRVSVSLALQIVKQHNPT